MVLRVAGINHFDPAARQRLIGWLTECSEKYGKPDFVAVEWDRTIFERVKAQREEFRRLVKGEWPSISERLLKTLALSLGYEGDAHLGIYASVEVLWLDEGRQARDHVWENYAKNRLRLYKYYLGPWPHDADDSEILSRISRGANEDVAPPENGPRDERFAAMILPKLGEAGASWAIAIVGRNHVAASGRSMRALLEAKGRTCDVSMI